jgi:hypothetical protein
VIDLVFFCGGAEAKATYAEAGRSGARGELPRHGGASLGESWLLDVQFRGTVDMDWACAILC